MTRGYLRAHKTQYVLEKGNKVLPKYTISSSAFKILVKSMLNILRIGDPKTLLLGVRGLRLTRSKRVSNTITLLKANSVAPDSCSYNIWKRALAAMNNISGVERVIDEMKRDGRVESNWKIYSNLSSIYVNAGSFQKAEEALKHVTESKEFKDKSQSKRAKANVKTWEIFMEYHLKNGDMNLAMNCIAKAISTGKKDVRKK
ncbi:hypothetical protein GIB67_008965 [Kingdonia uniflora]|uniref:Pentatricopeptide repeat-containing protein n=1 Tax=Kingdonia uniflora TaxID=39325 RepID=A0A7J7LVT0_9MAGN|nr:hypothetical protein GIB67_008965 [Kingdonia uniflora]